MGDSCFGLNYDELIRYAWIETTDEGLLANGGKIPDGPVEVDIPPFPRKLARSN